MKKGIWLLLLLFCASRLAAQTVARFNFSASSLTVSGWNNLHGDPSQSVLTATDATSGISLSSVNPANWFGSYNPCDVDGSGDAGTYFPGAIMTSMWAQVGGAQAQFNAAVPQFQISGLNPDSLYTIQMSSSVMYGTDANPTQYTVAGLTMQPSQYLNLGGNTSMGVTFPRIAPDASGNIKVYVNTTSSTVVAGISGIQILSASVPVNIPVVHITTPANLDVLAEETNIVITATASETGTTISKVDFVADSTFIGEVTTAPYTVTWMNPGEGQHILYAIATDANGNANYASVQISVESLTSFWSMTGNIGMNPDSNFVGNVDSVRLAFRTKNIERMSISPTGNVGIGTINPGAQLHTTGKVRFAGMPIDSTNALPRVVVSDTSGNLFYRSATGLSRWVYNSGTLYDSSDNIAIGTNNPQGYKLAVNGTAIFTKVRVKTAGTWPDYVFAPGYALPDLQEVAKYVAEHRHLPGVAPEKEVQDKGIDVSEHEATLLKKIEELTLYLIEQNKAMTEQKARLDTQQKEIDELKALLKAKK